MYNSIVLKDSGLTIWITQEEADAINLALLRGDRFVLVQRICQTFNTDTFLYVGANRIFLDPKVKGGEFTFGGSTLFCKNGDKYFMYQDGWKPGKKEHFESGKSFEDVIRETTINLNG